MVINMKKYNLDDIISKIAYGNVLLFVGAGFSKNTVNINGTEPPLADELVREFKQLAEVPENENVTLKEISDYFLVDICRKTPSKKEELINLLQGLFTIKDVSDNHSSIINLPWKRIYTTNYDDAIKLAGKKVGKNILSVSIDNDTAEYRNKNDVCIHINGQIENLTETALDTTFKLSHSSYLSPHSFINSKWNYTFKKDLEICSAIVFIGYSLYDLDIEQILYENTNFKNKTFFIKSSGH